MDTANQSAMFVKRDLHVGGLGAGASRVLAAVVDPVAHPIVDPAESWIQKVRDSAISADDYVRARPWQAIGIVALLGLAVGYVISSRRS
jgi:ElaB/YqjD/DUF883 family membrane-anchored ribosome-binding protein